MARKPIKRHQVTRNGKTFWRGKGSGSAEKSGSGKEFEAKKKEDGQRPSGTQVKRVREDATLLQRWQRSVEDAVNEYDKEQSMQKLESIKGRLQKRLGNKYKIDLKKHGSIGVTDVSLQDVIGAWAEGKAMPKGKAKKKKN